MKALGWPGSKMAVEFLGAAEEAGEKGAPSDDESSEESELLSPSWSSSSSSSSSMHLGVELTYLVETLDASQR